MRSPCRIPVLLLGLAACGGPPAASQPTPPPPSHPLAHAYVYEVPSGRVKYMLDEKGRQTHDLTWGPGYLTSLGVQWVDGKMYGVWPNHWVAAKGAPEITYKGIVSYKIPPYVIQAYKK